MTREARGVGVVAALGAAAGFATLAVWGKLAPQVALSTQTFLVLRFGLAALALLVVARQPAPRERWRQIAFGLYYTVQTSLYFAALEQTSASVATLLLYLAPAFVVLYEWLLGTRPSASQLLGLALSSLGLVVIVGLPSAADGTLTGFLLAALSGACYAGYIVMSGRLFRGADPLALTANASLGSAAGFVVLGLVLGTLHVPSSLEAWGVVSGAVVFATLLAIPLMFRAIAGLGATQASLLFTLEPVFVAVLALAFLNEGFTLPKVIGGALILAGAFLAQLKTDARDPSAQSS
jgi:drug/metabolite transporter (DMT)-like permease